MKDLIDQKLLSMVCVALTCFLPFELYAQSNDGPGAQTAESVKSGPISAPESDPTSDLIEEDEEDDEVDSAESTDEDLAEGTFDDEGGLDDGIEEVDPLEVDSD